jgi:hypothetical protein
MEMYIYSMSKRTQITLTERQHALLLDEAFRSGLSMAELVRRAVDSVYRPYRRPSVRGVEVSLGVWRRPDAGVVARRVLPRRVTDES